MSARRPLYRQFAELDVLDFARLHGPLPVENPGSSEAALRVAWEQEQKLVCAVLKRWDRARAGAASGDAVRLRDTRRSAARGIKRLLADWRTDDEKERTRLAQDVNRQLARFVTLRLSSDLDSVRPVSKVGMLGVVWLYMARAIAGESPEKECRFCGEEFTSKRSDARFCSAACKLKANRAK